MKQLYIICYERIDNIFLFKETITSNYPSKESMNNVLLIYTDETMDKIYSRLSKTIGKGLVSISPFEHFFGSFNPLVLEWIGERKPNMLRDNDIEKLL